MGVTGLWGILEPTGKPTRIQTLRGKVLAVDVSIWLHQSVKGYRDKDGRSIPNAHLLGVFHRVCKLLSQGIKPVFVFDGGVPALKRQTMTLRKQRKIEARDKSDISRNKLMSNLLRQQLQRQFKTTMSPAMLDAEIDRIMSSSSLASGGDGVSSRQKNSLSSSRPSKSPAKSNNKSTESPQKSKTDKDDDGFEDDFEKFREKLAENFNNFSVFFNELDATQGTISDSDDSDYGTSGCNYDDHFSNIISPTFDELPLETQHEMLFEMQESKKNNSWGRIDQMPKELQSFSSFQMERLRKRWTLQKKIQTVQKEMGNRHIHLSNFDDLAAYNYDTVPDAKTETVLASHEKGMIYVKSSANPKKETSTESSPDILTKTESVAGPSSSSFRKGKSSTGPITIEDYEMDWSSSDENDHGNKAGLGIVKEEEGILTEEQQVERAIKLSLATNEDNNEPSRSSSITEEDLTEEQQLERAIKLSLATDDGDAAVSSSTLCENENDSRRQLSQTNLNVTGAKENDFDISSSSSVVLKKCSTSSQNTIDSTSLAESNVDNVLRETVATTDFPDDLEIQSIIENSSPETVPSIQKGKKIEEVTLHSGSSSDDDDDFVDVLEEDIKIEEPKSESKLPQVVQHNPVPVVKIQIDPNKSLVEDDIFADVFKESVEEINLREKTDGSTIKESLPRNEQLEFDWNEAEEDDDDVDMIEVPSTSKVPLSTSTEGRNQQITRTLGQDPTAKSTHMITAEYLQAQQKLRAENEKLQSSKGAQDRIATSITDQMYAEAQELLALFGVPYIISPMEAESQCAFLDTACLTDGSITDDSDIWLFGAQRVYKNFFSQGERSLELFEYADIVKTLNLDREKLVLIAILTGSDYTDGVEGVGPVKALEIISEFTTSTTDTFDILVRFREWWEKAQEDKQLDAKNRIRDKFRKIKLRPSFPSRPVYDAYLEPTIDTSTEKFSWGSPDLDALRTYAREKFGWDQKKCDANLLPLMKILRCQSEETSRQLTMDSFVTSVSGRNLSKRKIKSKRLKVAMKKLKHFGSEAKLSSEDSEEESEGEVSSKDESDKELDGLLEKMGVKKVKFTRQETMRKSGTSPPSLSIPVPERGRKRGGRGRKTFNTPQQPEEDIVRTLPSIPISSPQKTVTVIPQKARAEFQKQMSKKKAIELFQKKKEEGKK